MEPQSWFYNDCLKTSIVLSNWMSEVLSNIKQPGMESQHFLQIHHSLASHLGMKLKRAPKKSLLAVMQRLVHFLVEVWVFLWISLLVEIYLVCRGGWSVGIPPPKFGCRFHVTPKKDWDFYLFNNNKKRSNQNTSTPPPPQYEWVAGPVIFLSFTSKG